MFSARSSHRFTSATGALAVVFLLSAVLACGGGQDAPTTSEARRLLEEGKLGEAIPQLEALLDETPDDRELNHLYGVALMATKRPSMAIWPLRKATEASDAGPEDFLLLGRAHLDGGSPSDALATADQILEKHPDLLEALQIRILANRALNKPEAALPDLEFILSRRPDDKEMILAHAGILLELERDEEASAALENARALMANEDSPDEWKARFCAIDTSFLLEREGEAAMDRVLESWDACLEAHPADAFLVTEAVAFYDDRGDVARSLEILRGAIEAAPQNAGFQVGLGQRLAVLGEHSEAEEVLLGAAALPRSEGWPALIRFYSERLEYEKALDAMRDWMALMTAPSLTVRMQYADLLIRAGEHEQAEEAIKAVEKPEFVTLLQGRLALHRGEPKRAQALLEQGIQLWPSNSVARMLAAEAALALGEFDRALLEYTEAVRIDTTNYEALSELAAMSEALGRDEPLGQYISLYIRRVPQDPNGHRLRGHFGIWSDRDGAVREAIRGLSALPGGNAAAVALTGRFRASKDPADAVAYLEATPLDLRDPVNREALEVLVETLIGLERHDAAIARADAAIEAHPDTAAFHELRGRALQAAGREADEIRASMERALELESGRPEALMALGRLAARAGDLDAALALYARADAASEVTDAEPQWQAVQALLGTDRDGEVDTHLEKLLADHGEHAGASQLLAQRIVAQDGDLMRAHRKAALAVRLGGGADARATLGAILVRRGEHEPAVTVLRKSLDARPDSPSTRYWLGVALARSGDAEGARAEFARALESPGFAEEAEARAELAGLDS